MASLYLEDINVALQRCTKALPHTAFCYNHWLQYEGQCICQFEVSWYMHACFVTRLIDHVTSCLCQMVQAIIHAEAVNTYLVDCV